MSRPQKPKSYSAKKYQEKRLREQPRLRYNRTKYLRQLGKDYEQQIEQGD